MVSDAQFLIWLIGAGIYLLASVALVPFVAMEKNRSGIGWGITSLLFSPLLALIALVAVPPGTAHEPASPFEAELRRR
jgi:hypothetical protein